MAQSCLHTATNLITGFRSRCGWRTRIYILARINGYVCTKHWRFSGLLICMCKNCLNLFPIWSFSRFTHALSTSWSAPPGVYTHPRFALGKWCEHAPYIVWCSLLLLFIFWTMVSQLPLEGWSIWTWEWLMSRQKFFTTLSLVSQHWINIGFTYTDWSYFFNLIK